MSPSSLSSPTGESNWSKLQRDRQIVVLVDPYSTGCVVAQELQKRGYLIVAMWTIGFAEVMKSHVPKSCGKMEYFAQIDQLDTLESTLSKIREVANGHEVIACLAGGEAGVDYADAFSEYLASTMPTKKILTNGTSIPNRRDKYIQQELCKQMGLRSVRQAGSDKFDENVQSFLKTEAYPVVLKPTESAGSDGVKLCYTYEDAQDHFETLMNGQLVNGGDCPSVLCQEFLKGTEYVIDHVSKDGVHKTCMIWVYDKRVANGANFVYFGMKPVDPSTPLASILINYTRRVLDALKISHGPTHGEVMMTEDGPCLVEMNCRAHGGDGTFAPLAQALTGGYSQVEMTADAFVDPLNFARTPDRPSYPFKAAGQEVIFVSRSKGIVKSAPGYDVIKMIPSFLHMDGLKSKGNDIDYTIDLVTGIGSVILMHKDPEVVRRDIDFVRYLEDINGFFVYETKLENLKRPRGDDVVLPKNISSPLKPPRAPRSANPHRRNKSSEDLEHQRVFSSNGPSLVRIMSNDRPELGGFGGMGMLTKRMTTVDSSREAVILVDPYSTGCCVAEEIMKRGFSVIALWTRGFSPEMKKHVPLSCRKLNYLAEVEESETLAKTSESIYEAVGSLRVVACLAGGEAGVDLADALSEHIKVRSNGTNIPNRRDKKVQQEIIRQHGLRSVRQAGGSEFADVKDFLETESYPVVLKPVESAGSDGVKLCHSFEEAEEHFRVLMSSQMVNGGDCPSVLCQEFLRGKEFVVDHVSRGGEHKTVMLWVYDKRPCHGSAFVYFGCVPVDSESLEAKILIPYVRGVLDALEFKNGPSHAEVMMTPDGPCLVEMNCRAHGGDGNWRPLCHHLTGGYSQVEATVDAFLDKKQFSILPSKPPSPYKASGQEVILVSFGRGVVKTTPGFEDIKQMPSFVYLETGVRPGSKVDYTIDLFTGIGSVILMHKDPAVLEEDIRRIRDMEKNNELFTFEKQAGYMKSPSLIGLDLIDVKDSAASRDL
jgi:biotin carboxylase